MSKLEVEYGSWFPSYGDLPMEIILHIFRYLGYSDRQAAACSCSRWYAARDELEFNAKTRVHFSKVALSDPHVPAREFLKTHLQFRHFHFEDVTIGDTHQFMAHIGRSAHSLYLDNVDLNDKQFYAIISQLPYLRELSVSRCAPLFMSGTFLEPPHSKELVTNLGGVRRLTLRDCQYLTDAIMIRITQYMPVLDALNLSGCPIAFHNAIYRRFYPNESVSGPSESVLTFEYIMRVISKHKSHMWELDFSNTLIGAALLTLGSLKLKRLYLSGCRQLVATNIKNFLYTQSHLIDLDLSAVSSLNNDCLECLVESNPQLQVLKVSGCLGLTNGGAIHLGNLKNLRHLDISSCDGITTEGIILGVSREENTVLRELNLSYLQICEECVKSVARNLTELRVLNVNHCVDGVTDGAVQCIIQNLRWLRELSVESCVRLTDAALTGINVSKLEFQQSTSQKSSMDNFYPPLSYSLAERDSLASSQQSMKISLRSKAEDEIVRDAKRKQAMFAAYEMNLIDESHFEGYNIQELRGLRCLNLKGCNKISDVSLKYGLRHVELRCLLLSNCQQISLLGMESLAHYCPSLEELDLSDCYNINDKTIQVITAKLTRLRSLHISGCSQLTDHSLDAILINCKCLQTLSVFRCRNMYMDIEERLSDLTTLRNLHMDNVATIDNAEFLRLKKRLDY